MSVSSKQPFERIVTKSGMRIILVPQPGVAATVLVMVEAGSKYETKEINGLSHFLEHMCFKGTTKRPKAIQISSELDGLGAEYNAFTAQEWTGYFAKVQAEKIHQATELIADLYLNPAFDAKELEKEKGVVIEEINMYEDLPPRRVGELFTQLLYGDQPAGWDIAGRKEVIQKLARNDLLKYRKEHYVAKATVVVIAGAFDPKKVKQEIEKHFAHAEGGKKFGKLPTKEAQTKPAALVKHKESDQTHLVVGVRAFNTFDKRRYPLEVLADILGGGMSSRLFEKVRNELGAAYYVRAGADLFSDHGYLAVSAGVDHKKLELVIQAILGEMKKLVEKPVPADELQRVKDHLSGRLLLGLETSDDLATFYGGQEVLRMPIETPADMLEAIRAVRAEDIRAVAREYIKASSLNLALIGPYKEKEPFLKLLAF